MTPKSNKYSNQELLELLDLKANSEKMLGQATEFISKHSAGQPMEDIVIPCMAQPFILTLQRAIKAVEMLEKAGVFIDFKTPSNLIH